MFKVATGFIFLFTPLASAAAFFLFGVVPGVLVGVLLPVFAVAALVVRLLVSGARRPDVESLRDGLRESLR
jgi:hypothetical protein